MKDDTPPDSELLVHSIAATSAMQSGEISTWTLDLQSDTTTTALENRPLFGYAEPRVVWGGPVSEQQVLDEDRSALDEAFTRALSSGALSTEVRVRRPDGAVHWVSVQGRTDYAVNGHPLSMSGVITDVTDRKREEAALRASNALLEQEVIERSLERERSWQVSPDLLSVIDLEGPTFDRVNPAWTLMLGWLASDMEGAPYSKFVHPDDMLDSMRAFQHAQGGKPVLRFENRYRHRDGSFRWLAWAAVPELGKLYSVTRDITEQKAQAASLAERTRERDRIWRNSQDIQVVIDADGIFIDVNPAFTRYLGWPSDQVIGRSTRDFLLADDDAATREAHATAQRQTIWGFENRYRHQDGSVHWISWVAAPDSAGETRLVYASGRDVTAEKRQAEALAKAEQQLQQSQKMEAVGQLTGGIAHDFNNLLTGISGSLELLQTRIAQGRVAEVDRYISAAQNATRRAATLTHRLLAFSRRQPLDPKPTDVNRLVGDMHELIERTIGPQIKLDVVGRDSLWPTLIDPSQLENALLNLCINARDAMPDGGRLRIETAPRCLDERAAGAHALNPGDYVALSVADTGRGMSPEVIARAFEPFFTTKPVGKGTGLGLSMIYGFARQSGGHVQISSEVSRGTTVALLLPRHTGIVVPAAQVIAAPIPAQRAAHGESVLVVDDDPTVRMLITDVLADLGYTAIEAADGVDGLGVLQSDIRIDLLVTDVGLPGGLDGRQLADAAQATRPGLRVLFITGYAENAALSRGQLGPDMHVITKPFAMDALVTQIRALIHDA